MRAVVVESPGPSLQVRVLDLPAPQPGPGEVLIEVSASAVCRTDLQIASGDLPPHRSPVIPGHQVVGRVVGGQRDGARVGLCWLARTCGECAQCRAGRENLCEQALFTGYDTDGGWAQQVVARDAFAFDLPDAAGSDVEVAPLLCGGVIGFRSLRVAGLGPQSAGGRLGLYGFGASASLALQVARYWGVECYVITRSQREVARARELGAIWAGTYEQDLPVRLDAAITFAPAAQVVVRALQDLDRGGIVAINAIHLDPIGPIPYEDLWWERQIRSVANVTRADVRDFLAVIGPAGVRTASEVLPLASAGVALRRLRDGDVTGAFVLVP